MNRIDVRTGIAALALTLMALSLSACTTVEGTNAMTSIGTFEREVMTETLKGVGIVPRETKPELATARAPLALPKDGAPLPPPAEASAFAEIPEDSDIVQIDATNLSEEDLRLLRNARVVDLRSVSGRPLTADESRKLTARMVMAKNYTGPRPLILPPDKYFTTTADGSTLICLAANGELVSVNDAACPAEVRRALLGQ